MVKRCVYVRDQKCRRINREIENICIVPEKEIENTAG